MLIQLVLTYVLALRRAKDSRSEQDPIKTDSVYDSAVSWFRSETGLNVNQRVSLANGQQNQLLGATKLMWRFRTNTYNGKVTFSN